MDYKKIIAADPGVNGGLAVWMDGEIHTQKMLLTSSEIYDFLKAYKSDKMNTIFFVESQGMRRSDKNGRQIKVEKLIRNHEKLISCAELLDLPTIDTHPTTWQSYLFGTGARGMSYTQRKKYFQAHAKSEFPSVNSPLWAADALCILDFARKSVEKNQAWINQQLPFNHKILF